MITTLQTMLLHVPSHKLIRCSQVWIIQDINFTTAIILLELGWLFYLWGYSYWQYGLVTMGYYLTTPFYPPSLPPEELITLQLIFTLINPRCKA